MSALPLDQVLAAFMFAGMIAFLFLGFPVAFNHSPYTNGCPCVLITSTLSNPICLN